SSLVPCTRETCSGPEFTIACATQPGAWFKAQGCFSGNGQGRFTFGSGPPANVAAPLTATKTMSAPGLPSLATAIHWLPATTPTLKCGIPIRAKRSARASQQKIAHPACSPKTQPATDGGSARPDLTPQPHPIAWDFAGVGGKGVHQLKLLESVVLAGLHLLGNLA